MFRVLTCSLLLSLCSLQLACDDEEAKPEEKAGGLQIKGEDGTIDIGPNGIKVQGADGLIEIGGPGGIKLEGSDGKIEIKGKDGKVTIEMEDKKKDEG